MKTVRLMLTGKMGSGKTSGGDHIERVYGATRWVRTETMKRLAHALADQVGDLEALLAAVVPDDAQRDEVRARLLTYILSYEPEPGKPRRLYQDVAQIVMDADPLAFEREMFARMELAERDGARFQLVDDVRSAAAFEFFAERGYTSVRIDASDHTRRRRMLERDGYLPAEETFLHSSETDLDETAHDYVVNNDHDDPERFLRDLDQVVAVQINAIPPV